MSQTERFKFGVSPMIVRHGAGVTNGTTAAQDVVAWGDMVRLNAGTGIAFVEPQAAMSSNANRYHTIDNLSSRLIVMATRSAGTGTWSATVDFRRATSNPVTSVPVTIEIMSSVASPIAAFDAPFPADFLKQHVGTETITDVIQCRLRVTPGSATAAAIGFVAIMAPGHVNSDSDKGANLSAPQFLIRR